MRTLLAFVLFTLPAVAAPVPKGVKKPSADGLWQLIEYSCNGQPVPGGSAELACKYWRVEGERMTQGYRTPDEARKSTQMFTLPVRDTDQPHLREMVWDGGSHRMSAALELRGEKLLFCVANDAGVVVTECKPKAGVYYHEFERVKGEK